MGRYDNNPMIRVRCYRCAKSDEGDAMGRRSDLLYEGWRRAQSKNGEVWFCPRCIDPPDREES